MPGHGCSHGTLMCLSLFVELLMDLGLPLLHSRNLAGVESPGAVDAPTYDVTVLIFLLRFLGSRVGRLYPNVTYVAPSFVRNAKVRSQWDGSVTSCR